MKRKEFTREEAEEKIGKHVTTNVDFVGIPRETLGRVVRAENTLDGSFAVVRWDISSSRKLRPRRWPYEDWFSKKQYDEFLGEI